MTTEQMARALAAAMKSLLEERNRQRNTRINAIGFDLATDEVASLPTRDEMFLERLATRPVIAALESAIRRVGQLAYEAGGIEEMHEVEAAACELEPKLEGKFLAITNSKWNGVGPWMA